MGEVKSAIDVHPSSTDCGASTIQQVVVRNEVSLLLSLYDMGCPASWSGKPAKAGA